MYFCLFLFISHYKCFFSIKVRNVLNRLYIKLAMDGFFCILSAKTNTFSSISKSLYNFFFFGSYFFDRIYRVYCVFFSLHYPVKVEKGPNFFACQKFFFNVVWAITTFFAYNVVHIFFCFFYVLFHRNVGPSFAVPVF